MFEERGYGAFPLMTEVTSIYAPKIMKDVILMGSPRKHGNTAALLKPFTETLLSAGEEVQTFFLYEMEIRGCEACRACQRDWSSAGCRIQDDMQQIFAAVLQADRIVLATPIYSWYCTAPMKAVLDRLVYGLNKYYGEKKGPSIWAGKRVAVITTCGYRPEKGADLFEEGIRRYCKHSGLFYEGMLAERHLGYSVPFMDDEKKEHAEEFARKLMII